ncbi:bifunctional folylpolyglutamate synthase/dihydrofolate synthase [Ruoffia tabacinasalis]|uniref:tetrahydrofolate synthase n=1 Tax=Ruoffia tabacinasalis TaxID=87458 RepID=A0ABS0LM50_9LACT|nr:folylpolyglutamate synthase/dihydrofolate synthase family protein [Ruoffia tabacinasalis]MBG9979322.1 bifunctional folylpolyglutamate synthase/dihydrofolate synthase [Ruoffia tabacinasalis]
MKFTTVEQATAWLDAQKNPKQRIGLKKIETAMNYVNNPHLGLPVIHITGTNGKGSTTTFLKELLLSQGLAVGTFTSPHIMRFNERISYNGENISDDDLIRIIEQMVEVNEYMETTEYGRLIFFELYTVMMALYFQEKQPDVCLIEVGIGGENDCTNVFKADLAILTTIGLDHEDLLGDTVEAVATEKSGIIKEKSIVVTGPIQASPLNVVSERAKLMNGSHVKFDVDYGFDNIQNLKENGSSFDFWQVVDGQKHVRNWQITMLGRYQIDNATIALKAFIAWMSHHGQYINFEDAAYALKHTKWMARMEKISENPIIYIDGAHNAHGLTALKSLVDEYFYDKEITILYAGLSTKNQDEQLPILQSFEADNLYLTQFDHRKALSIDDFEELADELLDTSFEMVEDWQSFLLEFVEKADETKERILLVTGSLYFVSDVRQLFLKKVKI